MSACGPWLELLVAHYADKFRDEFDVLVAFIHWCYVSRGCVGLGSPPSNFELTPARVASLLRGHTAMIVASSKTHQTKTRVRFRGKQIFFVRRCGRWNRVASGWLEF